MNSTPSSLRTRIALFGRANAGKSSLINALTDQSVALVSDQPGTTTDPVTKAMELLPLGPVTLIDTAGLDDNTPLGHLRIERALKELPAADIVLLVCDACQPPSACERAFLDRAKEKPLVIAANKSDLGDGALTQWAALATDAGARFIAVSARARSGIHTLKELLASMKPDTPARVLVRDLVPAGAACVLVVPIDSGAPKGRLILPQQQVIRELLEGGCVPVVCRDADYPGALAMLRQMPALVVTDSQVFGAVAKMTPCEVPLTSFSMLFARYKGELDALVAGFEAVKGLRDGDKVLICEGCTHHRQCEDIGTIKIPGWLSAHTGARIEYAFASGADFPQDLQGVKLIVHCGGCMLTAGQMKDRIDSASRAELPMVNYGVLIAGINGILARCLKAFKIDIVSETYPAQHQ